VTVVDVHLVAVVSGAAEDPMLASKLVREEWNAAKSLGFAADRDRAVTARAAARLELGRRLGVHPRAVPLLAPEVTGGRPVVAGTALELSWSHSGAWVALAIAAGHAVGVHIEVLPEQVPLRALATVGQSSLEEFVAREAAGKASGAGLWESCPPNVCVRPFDAPAGYLGAVAAPGRDWSIELKPFEPGEPPAVASAVATGVWDPMLLRTPKATYAVARR
jgi:hypothetical protein